jgi:hypothetical protein
MKNVVLQIWKNFAGLIRGRQERLIIITYVDNVPKKFKANVLYAVGRTDPWRVAMLCPCGCKCTIHLSLLKDDRPKWHLAISDAGLPTLQPSILRIAGCKSHFFLIKGEVIWCENRIDLKARDYKRESLW